MSKDVLVKIANGSDYTTVAGLRTRRLAFNAEVVDASKPWKGQLHRVSLSGRGIFKNAAADSLIRVNFFDGAVKNYQIVIPAFGMVKGLFQITNLEFAGEHNGEVTYDVALESAGEVTFDAH